MICRGWQDRRTYMGILKVAGKVLLIPLWFIISIIGAGVKLLVHMVAIAKKILGGNYGVVHRNSDLLSRLATGSFSGLYGRCFGIHFACRRIYRYYD